MSEPSPEPSIKRLSEAEWAEAAADFELGKATATALAAKYGVDRTTISRGMKLRGKVYGARSKIIEQATIDAAKTDSAKRVEEIAAMKENQRKLIETTQKMATKLMMDSINERVAIGSKHADARTLALLMKIHSTARAELWEIYGLNADADADQEMPEFAVSEYTPDELEMITRQNRGEELTPDDALDQLTREALSEGQGDGLDELLNGA
jgi:transposase-like protein